MGYDENGVSVFAQFLARYGPPAGEFGPERMAYEVFGVKTLDPWQLSVLRAFGRGERRISISSCHGPGKTFVANMCIWNMLLCRFPQKTVATAPTRGQIFDALFAEVKSWGAKLPPQLRELFEFKSDRIELRAAKDDSFFSARTARAEKPEALQGIHSENVLLVADEASGVPEQIFEAAIGSMSGLFATTLLLSNPTRSSGFFYDTHHKLADMWFRVTVSADDSPRVSDDYVRDVARRYGEDSNAYRVRVLGLFPKSDDDTIIPYEMVAMARQRDIVLNPEAPIVWGLDCARFGDDLSVLYERQGKVVTFLGEWKKLDTMQVVGQVKHKWDDLMPHARPRAILVDVIGLGAGVVDRLRELGLPVRGINVGEAAAHNDKYRNLRTELWFKGREWLAKLDCKLPDQEKLVQDLVGPRYTFTSTGKFAAEGKKDMKKRGYASPNHADAFLLTLAENDARIIHGGEYSSAWNQPLKHGRPVV